ncbi:MAG: bifunctional 4-hydroxy-2-oxoglutarate aldolase/2-dehydro-3-deoxy-phosphogluconate aldolase [Blastocatellia bacterium]
MQETLEQIAKGRVIAILRGDYGAIADEIVATMSDAGLTAVEVTFNSPGVLEMIRQLAARFGDRMAVGAGTVLKPSEVEQAAEAGARFIVSPNLNLRVIRATKRLGLVSLPGCFTPTEIVTAMEAGADAAKLFPASSLGVGFVRALRGPLPDVPVVPTGGVTPEMARQYFDAGAWAIGVGSELVSKDVFAEGGLDRLRLRAAAFATATFE